jgi:hypothetical protein
MSRIQIFQNPQSSLRVDSGASASLSRGNGHSVERQRNAMRLVHNERRPTAANDEGASEVANPGRISSSEPTTTQRAQPNVRLVKDDRPAEGTRLPW